MISGTVSIDTWPGPEDNYIIIDQEDDIDRGCFQAIYVKTKDIPALIKQLEALK